LPQIGQTAPFVQVLHTSGEVDLCGVARVYVCVCVRV
jgi:hypothetical protein